jgi:hypothetical protein
VPFAVLRPEASAAHPFLGQSLLGNANVFKALFNRCSEEDNVCATSWSMLTVSVAEGGDVEARSRRRSARGRHDARADREGPDQLAGPDQSRSRSPARRDQYLVQEIYRMAHVTFQRDSRDAESAEALR